MHKILPKHNYVSLLQSNQHIEMYKFFRNTYVHLVKIIQFTYLHTDNINICNPNIHILKFFIRIKSKDRSNNIKV